MSSDVRVRFAPSPTGPLHIGGVRTALYNYLFARKNKGTFILRIEDTDQARYVEGAEDYIIESLDWCGIKIDEGVREGGKHAPYRQSERRELYKNYTDRLIADGKAYYAFDTPEELEALRLEYESRGEIFMYNTTTRKLLTNSLVLPGQEWKRMIGEGVPAVVRLMMPEKEDIAMRDIIRGDIIVNSSTLDDKILFKADGMPTYHLANVVDDHLMEISHVIRGEEWLPSLPLHVMLYRAFGWDEPQFAHLPLLLKPTGKGKLSKRDGDKMGFPVFPLYMMKLQEGTVKMVISRRPSLICWPFSAGIPEQSRKYSQWTNLLNHFHSTGLAGRAPGSIPGRRSGLITNICRFCLKRRSRVSSER